MRALVLFVCCSMTVSASSEGRLDIWTLSRNIVKNFFTPRRIGLGYSDSTVFSPFSMEVMLMILTHGAGHQTLQELLTFVGSDKLQPSKPPDHGRYIKHLIDTFDQESDEDLKLKLSNRLFVNYHHPINRSYAYEIKELYNTDVVGTNMNDRKQTRDLINNWIENESAGKITDFFIDRNIRAGASMLPVSYLHFKGKWPHKFPEKEGIFKQDDGQDKTRTFLTGICSIGYEEDHFLGAQVLSMDFVHKRSLKLVMNFFLPHSRYGLNRMLEKLSNQPDVLWKRLSEPRAVNLTIPQFELDRWAPKYLWKIGMSDNETLLNYFFKPRRDLDFNKIFPGATLSSIEPKAFIEVTSEGVNIAPTTSVPVPSSTGLDTLEPEVQFTADHPFAFSILNEPTGDLLFVGTFKGEVAHYITEEDQV